MKQIHLFSFLVIGVIISSCANKAVMEKQNTLSLANATVYNDFEQVFTKVKYPGQVNYDNFKGYWENGDIITSWDCPDSKFFPPIDLNSWDKTPVVNGRFPTFDEILQGISIHHYGEKENPDVKPFKMTLPKLAYCYSHAKKKTELVVVIQIVQTAKETIVGYRYLTGGVGGSLIEAVHFLTDAEIAKVPGC